MNKNLDWVMNSPYELSNLLEIYKPELFYTTREKNAIARKILVNDHLPSIKATKNFNNKKYVSYDKDALVQAAYNRFGVNFSVHEGTILDIPLFKVSTDQFTVNIERLINAVHRTEYLIWHHSEIIGKQIWERENKFFIDLVRAIINDQNLVRSKEISRESIIKLKAKINQYDLVCKNLLVHTDYKDIIQVIQDRNILDGIEISYCDQMVKDKVYMFAEPSWVGAMPILHEPTLHIQKGNEPFEVFVNYQEEIGMFLASHRSVACLEIER